MPQYFLNAIGMTRNKLSVGFGEPQPTSGHNWLVRKAFEFITKNCPDLLPPGLEETNVHYGLCFADYPAMGRPESVNNDNPFGTRVPGVREDLWGKTVASDGGAWGDVKVFYGSPGDNREPNLCLYTYWLFEVLYFDLGEFTCAADNLSHYANVAKLKADGTEGSEDVLAEGPGGRGPWRVGGSLYAYNLYELACRFWPGSPEFPRLDKVSSLSKGVGRLYNYTSGIVSYAAEVPGTYPGSNPFILTQDGKPTWPIWVPDEYSPEKLRQVTADQSKRAAAIYLGWANHILQDLAVPFHAKDRTGTFHRDCEQEVDQFIQQGKFDHLPVFRHSSAEPAVRYKYSHKQVYYDQWWQNLGPIGRGSVHFGHSWVKNMEVISGSFYNDVHKGNRSSEQQTLAAFEYLLDIALKMTIEMVVGLDQLQMRAAWERVVPALSLLLLEGDQR